MIPNRPPGAIQMTIVPGESPHLEGVAGPLRGQSFALTADQETTIGRDPSNTIPVLDSALSRNHCSIVNSVDGWIVKDCGSRNHTYLNNQAVKSGRLFDGDEIRIGASIFRFFAPSADDTLSGTPVVDAQTVILRQADAIYLRASPNAENLPANLRTVRDLNALASLSRDLTLLHDLAGLQDQVLKSVTGPIPAGRAAILLAQPDSEGWAQRSWDRRFGLGADFAASRTIVNRVFTEGVAILSNDIPNQEDFQSAESLVIAHTRSVLAVPLDAFGDRLGVLYLDGASGADFDQGHLQLLTALGNVAALGIVNVRHFEWLEGENRRLNEELNVEHNMVGESPALAEVIQFIKKVAPRDSTVLIWGESGTGKELVARAIHRNSTRVQKAFVAINCAALTETLLESELFGYEKGAFTGAVAQKRGKIETADGGTIFLDEIGEMTPSLQAKMLRVLQEREFERVGGTKTIRVDLRVIAATNRDLKEMSRSGAFRQDLYYRLNVVSIRTPALREHKEDIPLLASHFAAKYAERVKRKISGFSPKSHRLLANYDWPGNVRELENAIERAVVLGVTDIILPEDLPELMVADPAGSSDDHAGVSLDAAIRAAKRQAIEKALEQTGGNQTEAAKLLSVHSVHLSRLIKTLDIKVKRR
jgi:transcriptional regulator with GAF, ATPase, and Fis domain